MAYLQIRFASEVPQDFTVLIESPGGAAAIGAHFEPPIPLSALPAVIHALEPARPLWLSAADLAALRDLGWLDENDNPARNLHLEIGRRLFAALAANPQALDRVTAALLAAERDRQALDVQLSFERGAMSLAALPWELLAYEGRFVVRDTSLTIARCFEAAPSVPIRLVTPPLRVLLVAPRPLGAPYLDPDGERRALGRGLLHLGKDVPLNVDVLRPCTFDRLVEVVRGGQYQFLHFDGHGGIRNGQGVLQFEDEYGGPDLVGAAEFADTLRNSPLQLVILSACQSGQAPLGPDTDSPSAGRTPGEIWAGVASAALLAGVPLVVGMQLSVPADAALKFTGQFYAALSAGRPVSAAMAAARLSMREGQAWFVPVLYGRPAGGDRLLDPARLQVHDSHLQELRDHLAAIEERVSALGTVHSPEEIAELRRAQRAADAAVREAAETRDGQGGVTPLYGVPPVPYFVGRRAAFRSAGEILRQRRVAVVWGTPGIGKTAFAAEYARRQDWRYPAGILWLSCQDLPAMDGLLIAMGAFAGVDVSATDPKERSGYVRALLAGLKEDCLLIWDGCEELLGGGEDEVAREFLSSMPANCRALLTTRFNPERLGWGCVRLERLKDAEMLSLLRMQTAVRSVPLGNEDAAVVDQLVRFLEGHPLALLLSLSLLETRSLTDVWGSLQRHSLRGVEASLALSYESLDEGCQALFTRLAVLTIAFTKEAAEALDDQPDAVQRLSELVRRSLVEFDGRFYRYHNLVRQFAYGRLKQREDLGPVHMKAAMFLSLYRGGADWYPQAALEACDQWEKTEQWLSFLMAAIQLAHNADRIGRLNEIEKRLERGQRRLAQHLPEAAVLAGPLLTARGLIARRLGDWNRAAKFYKEAIAACEHAKDQDGQGAAYNELGEVYRTMGRPEKAIELYQKALAIGTEVGDRGAMAAAYANLGLAYWATGEWERAIEFYEKDLALTQEMDDERGLAITYRNLGEAYLERGEWRKARDYFEKALEIAEKFDDERERGQTCLSLGILYENRRDWQTADEYYRRAQASAEKLNDTQGVLLVQINRATTCYESGDVEEGIALYDQALALAEAMGDVVSAARVNANLGNVYADRADWEEAERHLGRAWRAFGEAGHAREEAMVYINLGELYRLQSRWDQAAEYYQKGIKAAKRIGDELMAATGSMNMGIIYERHGDLDRAAQRFGEAVEVFERLEAHEKLAMGWVNLAEVYSMKRQWARAEDMYRKAVALLERLDDRVELAHARLGWANGAMMHGESARAVELLEQALPVLESVEDAVKTANAKTMLHSARAALAQDQAGLIAGLEETLATQEGIGDAEGAARTCGLLTAAHAEAGDLDQALAYGQRSLDFLLRAGDRRAQQGYYKILADLCRRADRPDDEVRYLKALAAVAVEREEYAAAARAYARLGAVCDRTDTQVAIGFYRQAVRLAEHRRGPGGQAERPIHSVDTRVRQSIINPSEPESTLGDWYYRLAALYRKEQARPQAIEAALNAHSWYEYLGNVFGAMRSTLVVAGLYQETGQIETARAALAKSYFRYWSVMRFENEHTVNDLIDACGSLPAAEEYLRQYAYKKGLAFEGLGDFLQRLGVTQTEFIEGIKAWIEGVADEGQAEFFFRVLGMMCYTRGQPIEYNLFAQSILNHALEPELPRLAPDLAAKAEDLLERLRRVNSETGML